MMHSPWFLLLLIIVPILAALLFAARQRTSVGFTSLASIKQLRPSLRQRLLWLPKALTLVSIALIIISLARPREGRERTVISRDGIAIEMVVDLSSSMRALDFEIEGQRVDRLTAVKNVAGKFISGDSELAGRYSDLIGLITFARFADGVTPPTLDHSFLVGNLEQTEIVNLRSEDGTAIGDAIALAVEKLTALDQRETSEKIKSKIMILLTDGENTAGELDPVEAAELAKSLGIKVYTIGVGTEGKAPFPVRDPLTGRTFVRTMDVNIDEDTLKKVADTTSGKYFRATDTDSLENIYREIDQLEKTEVESNSFTSYRELAVQTYRNNRITLPPLLLLALIALILRIVLETTWLRETSV